MKLKLPEITSIFTAEMFAIREAIRTISNQTNKNYILYTDSLSCLLAIKKPYPKSKQIQDIQEAITDLKNNNTNIKFTWIPSRTGINGNEKADQLAKEATSSQQIETSSLQTYDLISNIHHHHQAL